MGSLMAGWQTNRSSSKQALRRSTSSMTRSEVQRFWRARERSHNRHLQYVETVQEMDVAESSFISDNSASSSQISSPVSSPRAESSPDSGRLAWWTKSKWAFLNEPPLTEQIGTRYAPQFEVAEIGANQNAMKRRNSMPV